MNRAELTFTVIDKIMNPLQNGKRIKNINIIKDYQYGELPDNKLDLIFPALKENFPVIINTHGGGFVKGDKKYRRSFCESFAEKGFFVINMNYRLAPKYPFPAAFEDVYTLLNHLPVLKEKYNLDLTKIIFTGDSSGGYMAAQTVATLCNSDLREALKLPACNIVPKGLICFSAFIDVTTALKRKMLFNMTHTIAQSISGLSFAKDLSDIDKYEYIKYSCPADFINEKWCPTLVVYSKKDFLCGGQGEFLLERLQEKNIPCDSIYAENFLDNHCYHLVRRSKNGKTAMQKALDFSKKLVK